MKKRMRAGCGILLSFLLLTGCADSHTAAAGDTKSAETVEAETAETEGAETEGAETEGAETEGAETKGAGSEDTADAAETVLQQTDSEMFTERDARTDYDENSSVQIRLNGDSAEATSDSVQISGTVITITEEASYVISGTLEDGRIVVDAPDTAKIQLVLQGADITSADCAALYILEADKVFVTLADNTENTLANGGTFTAVDDNNIDGAVFSKQDLTLNGSGSLAVTSPAGHGIVAKDDLVITGGTYTIAAASHGLDANDSIRITGETVLSVEAGKDGLHAENSDDAELGFVYISGGTAEIEAEGDGISAGAYLQIKDGTFQITAGGGSENGTKASSDSWGDFGGRGGPGQMGNPSEKPGEDPGTNGAGTSAEDPGANMTETSADDSGANTAGTRAEKHGENAAENTMKNIADSTEGDAEGTAENQEDSSTSMKGMKAEGNLVISGGDFTIDAADDSIHSNTSVTINGGNFTLATGDDGIHGDESLLVAAGTILITESYEGLEALELDIQGGDITLTAFDDGLNAAGGTDSSGTQGGRDGMFGGGGMGGGPGGDPSSSSNGSISISGGTLNITASGDGIDANGSVVISGGTVVVSGPTQGDTSILDYDTTAAITGGTFLGTGAAGMTQTFSDAQQGMIAVSVGEQEAGTSITVTDQDGNTVTEHTPQLSFQAVIYSSPELLSGETYTVTAGNVSGSIEAD